MKRPTIELVEASITVRVGEEPDPLKITDVGSIIARAFQQAKIVADGLNVTTVPDLDDPDGLLHVAIYRARAPRRRVKAA